VEADTLPKSLDDKLTNAIHDQNISAVIISTEPLVHRVYGLWALNHGLHVLLDKPISTRMNAAWKLDEARGIWTDFDRLRQSYEARLLLNTKLICSVNVQRRYHLGFWYARDLIEEVSLDHQQPVTAVHSFHSDGQLRLPEEMKNITYHSFNQGHGKISHSGYHFIDQLMEFYKAGVKGIQDPKKKATGASVSAVSVQPEAFATLQTQEECGAVSQLILGSHLCLRCCHCPKRTALQVCHP
jgi:predicted dehydrogenase